MTEQTFHIYEYPLADGMVYNVRPYLDMYADNGNFALGLERFIREDGFWEPFIIATVNTIPLAYLEAAIDTNNNGSEIVDFLQKNGFGEMTPFVVRSGFCVYPVFHFNEENLMEIDPKAFQEYAKAFGMDKQSLDTQIVQAGMKTGTQNNHQMKEQER